MNNLKMLDAFFAIFYEEARDRVKKDNPYFDRYTLEEFIKHELETIARDLLEMRREWKLNNES